MTFCGKCGSKNPDDSRFCWQCGAKLFSAGIREELETEEKESSIETRVERTSDPEPSTSDIPKEPLKTDMETETEKEKRWEAYKAGFDAGYVIANQSKPEEAQNYRQDPGLKDGYTMIDENTVGFAGRRFSIRQEDIFHYKAGAWICIIATYVIGLYFLFGYTIHFDGGLNGLDATIYDICTGGYESPLPIDIMFILAAILILLSIVPFCAEFGTIVCMVLGFSLEWFVEPVDVIVGTLEVTYYAPDDLRLITFAFVILMLIIGGIGSWLVSKAMMPAQMKKGVSSIAAMCSFYSGRQY